MNVDIVQIIIQVVVFLFAISVHESAHAWTASYFGDPTARMLGRVSLNPIRHIDLLGTVILPLMALVYHFPMIGWAKPTPVDPRNFGERYVFADIMTSVAGPVSNFIVAIAALIAEIILLRMFGHGGSQPSFFDPLSVLFIFSMEINILLAIFNLIPIPPLDGSHVLRHFLSESARTVYDRIGWIGLILFFLVGGRVIATLMAPVTAFFFTLLQRFA
ncbi:MAG: site-2 protease family protein [Acidobacteria bacterium]|nr:site-2 protease family protein [Acidobacteriota bacterium]